MRLFKTRTFVLIGVFLLMSGKMGFAVTQTDTFQITIPSVTILNVSNAFDGETITAVDMDAAYIAGSHTFTDTTTLVFTKNSGSWTLDAEITTFTDTGSTGVVEDDFQIKVDSLNKGTNNASSFTTFSTSAATNLASHTSRSGGAQAVLSFQLINIDDTITSGDVDITITYTLT